MGENIREIVNGKLLPQFNGKKVSITGLVTNTNPNGLSFEIRSVDDVTVKINLKKPHQGILEGHVEVHGTSQGNSVSCDEIVGFKMDDAIEFDVSGHNSLCRLLNSIPNLWKTA